MTIDEYWMGRKSHYPPTEKMISNATEIVRRANELLACAEMVRGVRSGYRPYAINCVTPNAAPRSKHMTCEAVDIVDNDGSLKSWCMANLHELETIGLWMESPEFTPSWCHVQLVPPVSGHRVFIP